MKHPRLRDSKRLETRELYPLGIIPKDIIVAIGGGIVYEKYTGREDLSGDDWGDIFADAIGGDHLSSPVGIADVVKDKMAWSMKTVKNNNPFTCSVLRLISGRCSPDYSYGITDPHEDIQKTGEAVLEIWNERINIAYDHYNPVRVSVLARNPELTEFCLYEEYIERYNTSEFIWKENKNGNLIGVNKKSGETFFTWQPHGSQFTIHSHVPENSIKFKLKKPSKVPKEKILDEINYNESWIEFA